MLQHHMDYTQKVENLCQCFGEIGAATSLQDVISENAAELLAIGITPVQISDFIEKLELHYGAQKRIADIYNDEPPIPSYLNMMAKTIIDSGTEQKWAVSRVEVASIFNGSLLVVRIFWRGAHPCPFCYVKKQIDITEGRATRWDLEELSGIGRTGSSDWLFYRPDTSRILHISDATLHEMRHHHFFQEDVGDYRISPYVFILFFNMHPKIDYTTVRAPMLAWVVTEENWSCAANASDDVMFTPMIKPDGALIMMAHIATKSRLHNSLSIIPEHYEYSMSTFSSESRRRCNNHKIPIRALIEDAFCKSGGPNVTGITCAIVFTMQQRLTAREISTSWMYVEQLRKTRTIVAGDMNVT